MIEDAQNKERFSTKNENEISQPSKQVREIQGRLQDLQGCSKTLDDQDLRFQSTEVRNDSQMYDRPTQKQLWDTIIMSVRLENMLDTFEDIIDSSGRSTFFINFEIATVFRIFKKWEDIILFDIIRPLNYYRKNVGLLIQSLLAPLGTNTRNEGGPRSIEYIRQHGTYSFEDFRQRLITIARRVSSQAVSTSQGSFDISKETRPSMDDIERQYATLLDQSFRKSNQATVDSAMSWKNYNKYLETPSPSLILHYDIALTWHQEKTLPIEPLEPLYQVLIDCYSSPWETFRTFISYHELKLDPLSTAFANALANGIMVFIDNIKDFMENLEFRRIMYDKPDRIAAELCRLSLQAFSCLEQIKSGVKEYSNIPETEFSPYPCHSAKHRSKSKQKPKRTKKTVSFDL